MGRVGSGPEFHDNFGSGRVGSSLVGRVGSGQENWTHVQLCVVPFVECNILISLPS